MRWEVVAAMVKLAASRQPRPAEVSIKLDAALRTGSPEIAGAALDAAFGRKS